MNQFRIGTPEGGLRGIRCPEGHVHLAPRPVCPECVTALFAVADAEKQAVEPIAIEFPVAMSALALAEQ